MNRVFYEPMTVNGYPTIEPPSGFALHERIAGWLALTTQREHGLLAGIAVSYSAQNAQHEQNPAIVTASWDGGPTAAMVASVLTHTGPFYEPASALVDWDAPNHVVVGLFGCQLNLHSRSPEYTAARDGVPVLDDVSAESED